LLFFAAFAYFAVKNKNWIPAYAGMTTWQVRGCANPLPTMFQKKKKEKLDSG
jgi:hypothetical protein